MLSTQTQIIRQGYLFRQTKRDFALCDDSAPGIGSQYERCDQTTFGPNEKTERKFDSEQRVVCLFNYMQANG